MHGVDVRCHVPGALHAAVAKLAVGPGAAGSRAGHPELRRVSNAQQLRAENLRRVTRHCGPGFKTTAVAPYESGMGGDVTAPAQQSLEAAVGRGTCSRSTDIHVDGEQSEEEDVECES